MTTRSTPTHSEQRYYYGTGKRKNAIAQVRLYPEGDEVVVNGRSLEQALPWVTWQTAALEPLLVTDTLGKFTVVAKLQGGGTSAWGDALRLYPKIAASSRRRQAIASSAPCTAGAVVFNLTRTDIAARVPVLDHSEDPSSLADSRRYQHESQLDCCCTRSHTPRQFLSLGSV